MTGETKIISAVIIITIVILGGGAYFATAFGPKEALTIITKDQQKLLTREGDNKITAQNSKVTITEFADFECEACGATFPIVKKVLAEYKGRVNFVHRYFPLPNHKNGRLAAQSAAAAGKQGKFWEMYDKLFEKQREWGEQQSAQKDKFIGYAKEIGLDVVIFEKDLDNKEIRDRIQQDVNDGNDLGVNSTPTFFINDERVVGGMPFDDFKKKLDEKLK